VGASKASSPTRQHLGAISSAWRRGAATGGISTAPPLTWGRGFTASCLAVASQISAGVRPLTAAVSRQGEEADWIAICRLDGEGKEAAGGEARGREGGVEAGGAVRRGPEGRCRTGGEEEGRRRFRRLGSRVGSGVVEFSDDDINK
jgi:hypothetical protein